MAFPPDPLKIHSASWTGGSWQGGKSHVCNCIGCCKKCGTCSTASWHTVAYCDLLQRQAKEREDLIAAQSRPVIRHIER